MTTIVDRFGNWGGDKWPTKPHIIYGGGFWWVCWRTIRGGWAISTYEDFPGAGKGGNVQHASRDPKCGTPWASIP